MDRWDAMAIVGAVLVGGGLHALVGIAWAAIFWGGLLMALPVIRTMRAKRAE